MAEKKRDVGRPRGEMISYVCAWAGCAQTKWIAKYRYNQRVRESKNKKLTCCRSCAWHVRPPEKRIPPRPSTGGPDDWSFLKTISESRARRRREAALAAPQSAPPADPPRS